MNKLPNQAYRWWALLSLWFLLGAGGIERADARCHG